MRILRSNYPPAEPEALRLLAPQRGLTAADKRPLTRPDGSGRPLPSGEAEDVLGRSTRAPGKINNLSQGRGRGCFGALHPCARENQQPLPGERSRMFWGAPPVRQGKSTTSPSGEAEDVLGRSTRA